MKRTLELSLGSNMENEINRVVENFNGMLFTFESHFMELKDKLQSIENSLQNDLK